MTDTGYKCTGKPLHVSDIVAERHMDTSGGQVNFDLTYWKITQHDGAFWRCSCGPESTEIKLDADLDIHFSIADAIDLQASEVQIVAPPVDANNQKKESWLFAKITIAALLLYILLRVCTPFLIAANIVAVLCAVLAAITIKLHGGIHDEKF